MRIDLSFSDMVLEEGLFAVFERLRAKCSFVSVFSLSTDGLKLFCSAGPAREGFDPDRVRPNKCNVLGRVSLAYLFPRRATGISVLLPHNGQWYQECISQLAAAAVTIDSIMTSKTK